MTSGDLAAWLLEQIAEDERVAQAAIARTRRWPATDAPWVKARAHSDNLGAGIAVLDHLQATFANPARVLAECAAKRAVVEALDGEWSDDRIGLERAVHLLAQPYRDRPGWRDEWRT